MRKLVESSIVVAIVAIVGVALWAAISLALNHVHTGEDTTQGEMVASKIATQVATSLACGSAPATMSTQTWTVNGSTVTASVANGTLHLNVTVGKRSYPIDRPLYTTCNNSGATLTANGAH